MLFYFTQPEFSIQAVGQVARDARGAQKGDDWASKRKEGYFCDYSKIRLLRFPVRLPRRSWPTTLQAWWETQPSRNAKYLTQSVSGALLCEVLKLNPELSKFLKLPPALDGNFSSRETLKLYREGNKKELLREIAKRETGLKRAAMAEHGDNCMICDFNFGKFYGELGVGFVEVHHLKLLSKGGAKENTVRAVIVSCANCHRMLHRKNGQPLDWRKLRAIVRMRRRGPA